MLSFDECLRHWAQDRPDAVALEEAGEAIGFAALERRTRQAAAMFADRGVAKGDRIAWLGKNARTYFELFYAAARVGVVMVPIGWRLAVPEIAYILADTGAKLLFVGEGFEDAARAASADLAAPPTILSVAETRTAIDAAEPAALDPLSPDEGVLQLYTSGTTGHPKGAVLSNRNLFALRQPGEAAGVPWAEWGAEEALLIAMPCAHIGGTGLGVMAMGAGARAIVLPEFTPDGVLDAFEAGATRMFIVPAALQAVVQHPRAATTDFSAVRFVFYGAAPIPLDLLREAVATIPTADFVQVYGMTETAGTVAALPGEDHDVASNMRMRSAGKPVPGTEAKIVDEQGAELPRGAVGELIFRSPSNMLGYWNLPEASAQALRDGWMHTGDAASMDEDGYIYIQDRMKDMIISGGENVYPAQVESAIYGHPSVAEVAVIGVPDEKWGEAVKAFVVARPGCTVDAAEIIAFARERLAAFKAPRSVETIAALPRNASGKILRRELRAPYWEGRERQVN